MMKGVTKMAEYLMGIDAGTGSVRVALFDFRGQNRAYAVAEYGTCLLYTSPSPRD